MRELFEFDFKIRHKRIYKKETKKIMKKKYFIYLLTKKDDLFTSSRFLDQFFIRKSFDSDAGIKLFGLWHLDF